MLAYIGCTTGWKFQLAGDTGMSNSTIVECGLERVHEPAKQQVQILYPE